MTPRLLQVRPAGGCRLWLAFADGSSGEVDLEDELHGQVFEPLRDPEVFRRCRLDPELRTVVWENGADLAPEFLYSRVRAIA